MNRLIVLLALFAIFPFGTSAQGLLSVDATARLNELFLRTAEVTNAINDVAGAAGEVSDAVRYAQQAENRERPLSPDDDWDKVVASYKAAAKKIQDEELATSFDETPFTISWKEFSACHTRDGALAVLDDYSSAFGRAVDRGTAAQARYDDLIEQSLTMNKGANKMIEILAPLPTEAGAVGHVMQLLNNVLPAISELLNAARAKKKKLDPALEKVKSRKDNLDFNVDQLRKSECNLSGNWSGTIVMFDVSRQMTLELRGEPGSYTVGYGIEGKFNSKPCVAAVSAPEKRLDFLPHCNSSLRFSLSFSDSYTSLSGVETDQDDPEIRFPIAMQKQ